MIEAFRVGPVETSDGNFTLYMACSPAGAVSAIAADDRAGLAELRKRAPKGPATCEPGLGAVGKKLGFRAAALSDEAKLTRAIFATMLHLERGIEPAVMGQLAQTIEIAQRFLRARPWQLVGPAVPVEITIALGGRERRMVASVMGAEGVEHGIALHESEEALARFVELAEQERRDEVMEMSFTSLTIDPGPAWAAEAVKAAFGDPIVVVPIAAGPGSPRPVTSEELTTLAAAMFAVSKLGPGRLTADVTIEVEGGGPCRATARIADRDAVSAPESPAWATRPARWSGPVPAAVVAVPVLPVSDLEAAANGLRALGFTVTEPGDAPTVSAVWPGLMIELVRAPSTYGGGCHVVVEDLDPLVAAWEERGVEMKVVVHGDERVAFIQVPGGLSLTFGDRLPTGYRPAAAATRPCRTPSRRRGS